MGQDSYRNLVIGFLLIGLFSVLILTAIYGMAVNYGMSDEDIQTATAGALDINDYRDDELLNVDTTTENFRERFESGDTTDVDDASGVFSVAGDIIGVITSPFNILAEVGTNLLGLPKFVVTTILAILNLLLIFGLWTAIRQG